MIDKMEEKKRVAVVGGGLVGALNACFFAQRGFQVDLFEMRGDIRLAEHVVGRSINLALSCRGREALRAVGLEQEVINAGIPMRARMIHDLDGRKRAIPYGTKDQYIMAVDRRKLNELLLSSAEKSENIHLHFDHKFTRCDFQNGTVEFEKLDGTVHKDSFDLTVGCDGAHSGLRRNMTKATRLNYKQQYIPHGYLELRFPPNENGKHCMEINYLHIWPRGNFMLIGLPNLDASFTGTLFMPFDIFNSIKTNDQLFDFFNQNFTDAIPLLGKDSLQETFFSNKSQSLISIECDPYHIGSNFLIMGDAAHAMVPFYGQGMNAGFEDCLIFDQILEETRNNFEIALPRFTAERKEDAKAICNLAMFNYIEMRDSVNSNLFLLRKKLDNLLHWIFPRRWIPLYTMVSFTRISYTKCIADRKWQNKIISATVGSCAVISPVVLAFACLYYAHYIPAIKSINLPKVSISFQWNK